MDLELEQDIILCYETVGQATVCQEETQEAIVPDACPDILRIAEVCAQAFPSRWEVRDGQATVIGFIQASVLYVPEAGELLRRMEIKVPFSVQFEMGALSADCILETSTRLRCADGRMLNPRKILLRADLAAEITAFRKKEYALCNGAHEADGEKLCQRLSTLEHERRIAVPQRIFPMSEEIRLTGTQASTVLSCRGESVCTESRVIGSKLIFKGKTDIFLLLQGEDGTLERRSESFPFSQIMEVKGASEGGSCLVKLELAELMCRTASDDSFRILLDTEVLAQGQVRERSVATLLTDLYSTSNHVDLEQQEILLHSPGEEQVLPQTLRDLLETEDVVRTICDSRFELGPVLRIQEGDTLCLSAQGQITVLYLDEGRKPRRIEKDVELTTRVNAPQGSDVSCRCVCPGELYAAPCAGGVEVRLNLEFHILTSASIRTSVVSKAQLGEPRSSTGVRPSIVLRLPEQGEDLWDIAKACGTTMERIRQANELTGEEIPHNKMLLIPSAR